MSCCCLTERKALARPAPLLRDTNLQRTDDTDVCRQGYGRVSACTVSKRARGWCDEQGRPR